MGNARALITGGSVGIGAALADVFAAHGHDLILVSRSRDKLDARGRAIREKFGVDVVCVPEDLADPEGARRVYDAVAGRGLDVHFLVNNAGVGLYGKFATTDLEAERKMIQLNVTSIVDLTKRFLPGMIARKGGRILNVASTAAFVPGPWMSVYYASKAFLLSFSQAIDFELEPSGITVTTLCPGPTQSEFKVRAGSQRSRLFEAFVMDAPRVARVGYDGMMKGKAVAIPGLRNKMIPIAARLAPRSLVAELSHRAARPSEKEPT
jgi:short-subunit dehydrogenase